MDELMPSSSSVNSTSDTTERMENPSSTQGENSLKQKIDVLAEEKQKLHEFMRE
jgi:hypothetical protein